MQTTHLTSTEIERIDATADVAAALQATSHHARIAYLDISKLLLTEQIDAFLGRPVSILGTAENVGRDLVIRVESLKLQ